MKRLKARVAQYILKCRFHLGKISGENKIHRLCVLGQKMRIQDGRDSLAAVIVANEINQGCYSLESVSFAPGDVVLDIGAHVGIFSCYLGLKYPYIKIYAFEPMPGNFQNLRTNVEANAVENVTIFNTAVTGDGRDIQLMVHPTNTGGASAQQAESTSTEHAVYSIPSQTLDGIFSSQGIGACKLLKIDCEGSEHEILLASQSLTRIEHLRGEFHINAQLEKIGYSFAGLISYCQGKIKPEKMIVSQIKMAE